jgi:hypothetical protein
MDLFVQMMSMPLDLLQLRGFTVLLVVQKYFASLHEVANRNSVLFMDHNSRRH